MKYILAADDEPANQFLLAELLGDCYEIAVVGDGVACMESIEKRTPDLLLLDVSMPRMNGLEVCHSLRTNLATKDIPVIMLSASATKDDVDRGIEAGANSYVTKPFSPSKLIAEIETLIGS